MADNLHKPRKLHEMVVESRFWDAQDLLRNFEDEVQKLEHGMGHMIWDLESRPVTKRLRPLPITPRFAVSETDDLFKLVVELPEVPPEHVRLDVDPGSVEVLACTDEDLCRPYYVSVMSQGTLDAESAELERAGTTYTVIVKKVRKKRLKIK
ncbi:MAG: Hsp20/alpha crystallin family protein [Thermoplasmata archaeon]|nr:Hsp20/alpha crystallin family protein [Thermoplasmata archaeon]